MVIDQHAQGASSWFSVCEGQAGPCGSFGDADVNGDTTVDILDFLDFLDAFGTGC